VLCCARVVGLGSGLELRALLLCVYNAGVGVQYCVLSLVGCCLSMVLSYRHRLGVLSWRTNRLLLLVVIRA
jgi:hypothetical protein